MRLVALSAVLLISSVAHAQSFVSDRQSPQFGVEVGFGPFNPRISGDATVRDYFELVYQPPETRDDSLFEYEPLLKTFEVDWYFFDEFGLLGVSGSIGHWSIDGRTRVCPDADDGSTCTPETVFDSVTGSTETSLTLVPMTAGVVYKFDWVKKNIPYLPFVAYAEAGLSYTYWRATAGGEKSSRDGLDGSGGNLGYYGSLGLALNLDWIEPGTSQKARTGSGISDTYLFFDANLYQAEGFRGDRLDFSDAFFQAGLSVDFF